MSRLKRLPNILQSESPITNLTTRSLLKPENSTGIELDAGTVNNRIPVLISDSDVTIDDQNIVYKAGVKKFQLDFSTPTSGQGGATGQVGATDPGSQTSTSQTSSVSIVEEYVLPIRNLKLFLNNKYIVNNSDGTKWICWLNSYNNLIIRKTKITRGTVHTSDITYVKINIPQGIKSIHANSYQNIPEDHNPPLFILGKDNVLYWYGDNQLDLSVNQGIANISNPVPILDDVSMVIDSGGHDDIYKKTTTVSGRYNKPFIFAYKESTSKLYFIGDNTKGIAGGSSSSSPYSLNNNLDTVVINLKNKDGSTTDIINLKKIVVYHESCFILTTEGKIYFCGTNDFYQSGLGNSERVLDYTDVTNEWSGVSSGIKDIEVSNITRISYFVLMLITLNDGTKKTMCVGYENIIPVMLPSGFSNTNEESKTPKDITPFITKVNSDNVANNNGWSVDSDNPIIDLGTIKIRTKEDGTDKATVAYFRLRDNRCILFISDNDNQAIGTNFIYHVHENISQVYTGAGNINKNIYFKDNDSELNSLIDLNDENRYGVMNTFNAKHKTIFPSSVKITDLVILDLNDVYELLSDTLQSINYNVNLNTGSGRIFRNLNYAVTSDGKIYIRGYSVEDLGVNIYNFSLLDISDAPV